MRSNAISTGKHVAKGSALIRRTGNYRCQSVASAKGLLWNVKCDSPSGGCGVCDEREKGSRHARGDSRVFNHGLMRSKIRDAISSASQRVPDLILESLLSSTGTSSAILHSVCFTIWERVLGRGHGPLQLEFSRTRQEPERQPLTATPSASNLTVLAGTTRHMPAVSACCLTPDSAESKAGRMRLIRTTFSYRK